MKKIKKFIQKIFYYFLKKGFMSYTSQEVSHITTIMGQLFSLNGGRIDYNSGNCNAQNKIKELSYDITMSNGKMSVRLTYNILSGNYFLYLDKSDIEFGLLFGVVAYAHSLLTINPSIQLYLQQLPSC
jgi:hypothetical protein